MAKLQYVTPVGIAKYPHIDKPDLYKGKEKYKIRLILTKAEAGKMQASLKEFIDDNSKTFTVKPKDLKSPFYEIEDDEDNVELSASSKYQPVVFDSKNNRLQKDLRIGGGSRVRLIVEPYAYDEGVSFRLKQVQVIELTEGGKSGFDEVEDGFESADTFGGGAAEGDELDI